jgi:Arc/MetJ family transcription regulator
MCIDLIIFVYNKKIEMRTNIEIDDKLMKDAMKISKSKSKKEVVNHALEELIRLDKRRKMQSLFGKVKWEGNLDEMRAYNKV